MVPRPVFEEAGAYRLRRQPPRTDSSGKFSDCDSGFRVPVAEGLRAAIDHQCLVLLASLGCGFRGTGPTRAQSPQRGREINAVSPTLTSREPGEAGRVAALLPPRDQQLQFSSPLSGEVFTAGLQRDRWAVWFTGEDLSSGQSTNSDTFFLTICELVYRSSLGYRDFRDSKKDPWFAGRG